LKYYFHYSRIRNLFFLKSFRCKGWCRFQKHRWNESQHKRRICGTESINCRKIIQLWGNDHALWSKTMFDHTKKRVKNTLFLGLNMLLTIVFHSWSGIVEKCNRLLKCSYLWLLLAVFMHSSSAVFFLFFSQVQSMCPSWKCFLEIYVQAVSDSLKLHDSWEISNKCSQSVTALYEAASFQSLNFCLRECY